MRGRAGRLKPWGLLALGVLVLLACALALAGGASAAGITNSGGDFRDGWYGDQPRLAPDAVADGSFGQLWDKPVEGQVYAQPLVVGNTLIVATERNQVYAFDADTGDQKWHVDLGPSVPASSIGCFDLEPDLGVTATPVIDQASGTIYLTHKTYAPGDTTQAAYYLDALDVTTGAQRTGFPRRFAGTAQNASGAGPFDATYELQRPGLLLMDGVVYAGFGGHCDILPYAGWIFGVNASSGAITARWRSLVYGSGAGIWQSGAGLMSDGPGRLWTSTGNGGAPRGPLLAPGSGQYGESIVRLAVQGDGSLKAQDFFAPSDGPHLDEHDADFASGGVTALRDDVFGTSEHPHIAVAVGKAGYVYLLNRDDLGGVGNGEAGGDRVLLRVGPYGGVWSRPGVWPGDGGWIAIPTASPSSGDDPAASGSAGRLMLYRYRSTDGVPSLDTPVVSDDAFGFSSSAPVITSQGTSSGSAVLWIIWAPNASGVGAQLRAYDAVPINGQLRLRRSFPIGTSSKFTMPGVGSGRIYVGTRDGHVKAFGAPVNAEVQAPATTFPVTTVGTTSTKNVTLSITGSVHVMSVSASPSSFSASTSGTGVPGDFTDGQKISVPVRFSPTAPGVVGGTLTVVTDKKTFVFSLSATAQGVDPQLTASARAVSFGGAIVGDRRTQIVTLANAGGRPLTISSVALPGAPFHVTDAPAAGSAIAPGAAVNLTLTFAPTAVGDYSDELGIASDGGNATIGLTGVAGLGPTLELTPASGWVFGGVPIGQSKTVSLTVANTGDSLMTITKSKPPSGGPFTVVDGLDEGSGIAAGQSRTIRVRFTPAARGAASATWTLNAADGSGVHEIPLTGNGLAPGHAMLAGTVAFPDAVMGATSSATATIGNDGDLPVTVAGVDAPSAPFTIASAPSAGEAIAAGASKTVKVVFDAPRAPGVSMGALVVRTSGGNVTVPLSAKAVTSGTLTLEPATDGWSFGDVAVGASATRSVVVRNTGAGPLTILDAAPPTDARFATLDALAAGTVLAPGAARTLRVTFAPVAEGAVSDVWRLATTAEAGSRLLALTGGGVAAPVTPPGGGGQAPTILPPPKARALLHVTSARLGRDGRRLVVRGRVAKTAVGAARLTVSGRVGRRIVTATRAAKLHGASSFQFTIMLPKTMKKWSRLRIEVRFAGSARVQPGVGELVLVRGR